MYNADDLLKNNISQMAVMLNIKYKTANKNCNSVNQESSIHLLLYFVRLCIYICYGVFEVVIGNSTELFLKITLFKFYPTK